MEADRSLSEIARAVLVDRPGEDRQSVREKAGLLALLNLLGIVEAFYPPVPEEESGAKSPPAAGPKPSEQAPASIAPSKPAAPAAPVPTEEPKASPEAPPPQEGPFSLVSALAKLMSGLSSQGGQPAQVSGAPAGPPGGPDPALLGSMLGLLSGLSGLARPHVPRPSARTEGGPGKAEVPGVDAAGEAREGVAAAEPRATGESGQPEPQGGPAQAAPRGDTGSAGPPSPLQQILGIDPKVLTLILNLVAELLKNRPQEQRERAQEARVEKDERAAKPALPAILQERTATGKRAPLGPRLYHKPGLGIYRSAHPLRPSAGDAPAT